MCDRNDSWGVFWIGAIAGVAAMVILSSCVPGAYIRDARMKREACEKSLPRDQHCVMRYEPERTP